MELGECEGDRGEGADASSSKARLKGVFLFVRSKPEEARPIDLQL